MARIQIANDRSTAFDLDDHIAAHRLSIARASVKFFELNC
jgi:hypothetical protein